MRALHTFATLLAAATATSMVARASPLLLQERDFWSDAANEVFNHQEKRIVVNPHITYPDETAVWHTGQKGVNVTWDVPSNAEGYKGRLLLGYLLKNDTSGNEHLFLDPLADGFNLTDGRVTVDIPCNNEIKSRNTYIVVLMGDSGNKSGNFTIHREVGYCPNLKRKKQQQSSTKTSSSNTTTIPGASHNGASTTSLTSTMTGSADTPASTPQFAPAQEGEQTSDQATTDESAPAEEQT